MPIRGSHTVFDPMPQSVRECPKILKIWQTANFDISFQKNEIISQSEKVDYRNILANLHLGTLIYPRKNYGFFR